jgi:hypothetical protein
MAYQFINRNIHPPRTPDEVAGRFSERCDGWLMTDAERLALTEWLDEIRPEVAIEVCVYRAGSLTALARTSRKVYAKDIDPVCETNFSSDFENVEFVAGNLIQTLPAMLTRLQAEYAPLGFILIEADHSRDGNWRNIESILQIVPDHPLYVLMHDSFNPECHRGMREAHWSVIPYVQLVELDLVFDQFVTQEETSGFPPDVVRFHVSRAPTGTPYRQADHPRK